MKKFTAKEKEKYLKQNQKRAFAMMTKTNGGNKMMDHDIWHRCRSQVVFFYLSW